MGSEMTKQAHAGNPLDLIRQAGLIHRADQLLPLFQPTIAASSQQVEFEREIPLGASKLGGRPDMPPTLVWPHYHERPLEFIAQINLAETAPYDADGVLPTQGRLLCFYDVQQWLDGDPFEQGRFCVYYDTSDVAVLQRTDYPETAEAEFRPCALTFAAALTLPSLESKPLLADIQLYDYYLTDTPERQVEIHAYLNLTELAYQGMSAHQLLGWPEQIQGDVFVEMIRAANGIPMGKTLPNVYQTYGAQIDEWQLLLQIDSDQKANMMWGDVGALYWCIRRDDLRNLRFDNVIVTMQCS
jgi:uncharacterized protein YwqG